MLVFGGGGGSQNGYKINVKSSQKPRGLQMEFTTHHEVGGLSGHGSPSWFWEMGETVGFFIVGFFFNEVDLTS